jgi:multiple sugar transport system permease protein
MAVVTGERETARIEANTAGIRRRQRWEEFGGKALIYLILFVGSVIFIAPFAWMVTASFQSTGDMFRWPPNWIPRSPSFDNYTRFFEQERIGRYFFNSAFVALAVTALQLFTSSLAAYTFAKRRFPGRDLLFMITLGTLMIPGQVTLIPNYVILKNIPFFGGNDWLGKGGHGWLDSYWGLIVPQAVTAFGIFLMRQYMKSIPDDLLDAARVDGGTEFRIYWQIVMPLCRPWPPSASSPFPTSGMTSSGHSSSSAARSCGRCRSASRSSWSRTVPPGTS